MCIAIVKRPGDTLPDLNTITNCFEANPHGAGYCYSNVNKKVTIRKGFTSPGELHADMVRLKLSTPHTVLIHFRWATHGLRDGGNTHPFAMTDSYESMRKTRHECDAAMIHNGVLRVDNHDVASDSMVFLKTLHESNIDPFHPVHQKMITLATAGSKLAFIRGSDGRVQTFGAFTEGPGGCLYSNDGWRDKTPAIEWEPKFGWKKPKPRPFDDMPLIQPTAELSAYELEQIDNMVCPFCESTLALASNYEPMCVDCDVVFIDTKETANAD